MAGLVDDILDISTRYPSIGLVISVICGVIGFYYSQQMHKKLLGVYFGPFFYIVAGVALVASIIGYIKRATKPVK